MNNSLLFQSLTSTKSRYGIKKWFELRKLCAWVYHYTEIKKIRNVNYHTTNLYVCAYIQLCEERSQIVTILSNKPLFGAQFKVMYMSNSKRHYNEKVRKDGSVTESNRDVTLVAMARRSRLRISSHFDTFSTTYSMWSYQVNV